jgi:hypothetical protein
VSTRAAAVLLVGLLFAAGHPASSGGIRLGRLKVTVESPSKQLAQAMALQVGVVRQRYGENRRALRTVEGADGKPAYLQQEVVGLITRTGEDLDQAIEKVQPSGTEPLRAWAAYELGRIQREIVPPPVPTASLPGLSAPRAVAVFASLRGPGLPLFASAKPAPPKKAPPKKAAPKPAPPQPAPPKPATIPAGTSNRILDEVAEVVERIFVLADHDDLEVKLWVGSTPAQKATFRFWPQGKVKGSAPAPTILQTEGKKDHVLRGLYSYRAAWGKGAVTQLIEYPNPAGPSATRMASERLDLVKGSRFFCCQFNDSYCRHVDDDKDCR